METIEAYLQRKYEELRLLDSCLHEPIASAPPRSIDEGIELKFKLTAALRAQHDLSDWTATETAWSPGKKGRDGPFEFTYDYQRADLEVVGPSFYDVDEVFLEATSSTPHPAWPPSRPYFSLRRMFSTVRTSSCCRVRTERP